VEGFAAKGVVERQLLRTHDRPVAPATVRKESICSLDKPFSRLGSIRSCRFVSRLPESCNMETGRSVVFPLRRGFQLYFRLVYAV
jgi:hypothetical protein